MRLTNTVILICLATACSGGENSTLLSGIDVKSISAISVVSRDQEVAVARKGGKWEAVKPDDMTIRENGPDAFIDLLNAKIIRTLTASDTTRVGLDKPAVHVELTVGKDRVSVEFGSRTADRANCYVRCRGAIAEVDADALRWIERGNRVFELDPVFRFDRQKVTEFVIEGGRVSYRASKTAAGEWLLVSPVPAPASTAAVASLLGALDGLNTTNRLDDVPANWFDKPYRKVALKVGGETKVLLIGALASKDGDRFAKAGDAVFAVKPGLVKRLDAELLTPLVVNVIPAQIDGITVTDKHGRHTLRRTADSWEWNGEKTASDAATAFLEECGSMQAEAFLSYNTDDLPHYLLTTPVLNIEIMRVAQLPISLEVGRSADKKEILAAGLGADGKYVCATGGSMPAVFLIKKEKINTIMKLMDDLSKRKTK